MLQAKYEDKVLSRKAELTKARNKLLAAEEEGLIEKAIRDQAVSDIENASVKEELQDQINQLRKDFSVIDAGAFDPLESESIANIKAKIQPYILADETSLKFELKNISQLPARKVNFKVYLEEGEENPIPEAEYKKFPFEKLSPGQSISLRGYQSWGSKNLYDVSVLWENPDGSLSAEDFTLSV